METKLMQVVNLINDAYSKRIDTFASKEAVKYTDEAIRLALFDILGEDKLTHRGWRNHKNEIFTIIEEVINTNLPLAWEDSPFYKQFVETRNGALGDKNEFYVRDASILVATSFAGNHWDTDRKKIGGLKGFQLDTEWIYIHVYDDFERFLKGLTTVNDLINAMQGAMNRAVDERIYTAFNGAGTYLPAALQVTGTYDEGQMRELIQRVQVAAQKNVILINPDDMSHFIWGVCRLYHKPTDLLWNVHSSQSPFNFRSRTSTRHIDFDQILRNDSKLVCHEIQYFSKLHQLIG